MKTLNLFGLVYPAPDCINADSVSKFLSELQDNEDFTVYINSAGGSVFEGLAIYNLLSEHQANMTIKIIGEATSIASVISCAGGEGKVLIAETALMMVHKPWTFAIVDEDYIKKLSKSLSTIKNSIITAYQGKTGLDPDVLDELMTEADYRDAKECVKLGFADAVYKPSDTEAKAETESNHLKNEILKKYLILNLKVNNKENNSLPPIIEGDNYMTFKNVEEAVVEIGRVTEKLSVVENQLTLANQTSAQHEATIKNQSAEIQTFQAKLTEAESKLQASEQSQKALQSQVFSNEAVLFCEKQFQAGKLTRAEINGSADLTKGETPAKVAKLLALRNLSQDLYDMECREIETRSASGQNYLSSGVPGGTVIEPGDEDYLANHVEKSFNTRK